MSGAASIEVSVRVRPFNSREAKFKCSLVIGMPDNSTCEVKPINAAPKTFHFDNCLWTFTHDDVTEIGGGDAACGVSFADQRFVYEAVGKRILDNALLGFNACLFAYGQTGSGKTYTMMGVDSDPGIIPRLCKDLFQRQRSSSSTTDADGASPFALHVEVTYLEIYNESVKDLLNAKSIDKALRVRQHPTMGVYVEGLTKWTVTSDEEVLKLLEDGSSVRSVAATKMNATSSRSHAILTLHIRKTTSQSVLASQLHLVDLAGSERASSTGAEGDTLVEGANINKSLTTLGMCLSRLAEASASSNSQKVGHVPYRDSQLTWILNDSLGGNSKTAMLANISPASINVDETLSTLRFASTVKKIKTSAVVNEDPQQRLIRTLREEIEDIKRRIAALEAGLPETITDDIESEGHVAGTVETRGVEGAGSRSLPAVDLGRGEAADATHATEASHATHTTHTPPVASSAPVAMDTAGEAIVSMSTPVSQQTAALTAGSADVAADDVVVVVDDEVIVGSNDAEAVAGEDAPSSDHECRGREETVEVEEQTLVDEDDIRRELLQRLEEDTTLMLQATESREEAVLRTQAQEADNQLALEAAFEALQVCVKLSCPRLITLNEDLHALPTVALLYYLKEGDTVAGDRQALLNDRSELSPDTMERGSVTRRFIDLPAAACRPSEVFTGSHFALRVDELRQELSITYLAQEEECKETAPDASSAATASNRVRRPCRVFVNGEAVRAGERRVLRHMDCIVTGLLAYRVSLPIRWTVEGAECFERQPASREHCARVEQFDREQIVLEAITALQSICREMPALTQNVSSVVDAHVEATMERVARLEAGLSCDFPVTQATLLRAASTAEARLAHLCVEHDYAFAMQQVRESQERVRQSLAHDHQQALSALRRQSDEREAEIAALRVELARQEEGRRAAACARLAAAEADARDVIVSEVFEVLSETVRVWRDGVLEERAKAAEKRHRETLAQAETTYRSRWEVEESGARAALARSEAAGKTAIEERIVRQSAAAAADATDATSSVAAPPKPTSKSTAGQRRLSVRAAPVPSRHVDAMVQLAADVRMYEDACREATLWKPNGPATAADQAEYTFSMTLPSQEDVAGYVNPVAAERMTGVLFSANVLKLKRGFLGRLSFHSVYVLIRERFLYYYTCSSQRTARALGAAYLFGAGVETSSGTTVIDGRRHTLRLVPSVPRKVSKSSRGATDENNIVFGFDSADEMESVAALIRRLSMPECPLRVKQYYASQSMNCSSNQGDTLGGVDE